jgi:hypothetical protein
MLSSFRCFLVPLMPRCHITVTDGMMIQLIFTLPQHRMSDDHADVFDLCCLLASSFASFFPCSTHDLLMPPSAVDDAVGVEVVVVAQHDSLARPDSLTQKKKNNGSWRLVQNNAQDLSSYLDDVLCCYSCCQLWACQSLFNHPGL